MAALLENADINNHHHNNCDEEEDTTVVGCGILIDKQKEMEHLLKMIMKKPKSKFFRLFNKSTSTAVNTN